MKTKCAMLILGFCILLAASTALTAQTPLQLPTWPQDFVLKAGRQATFMIPNPGTGTINVTVTWTGSPISIGAVACDKTVILPPALHNAPSFTFTIDTKSVVQSKSPVFVVSLELPGSSGPRARAAGKINVESPPVDMEAFQGLVRPLIAALPQKPPPPTKQQADALTAQVKSENENRIKAQENHRATLSRLLQLQSNREVVKYRNTVRSLASPRKQLTRLTGRNVDGLVGGTAIVSKISRLSPVTPITPMLRSVNPAAGMSGQQVTVIGQGLASDATEIDFTIAAGVIVPASIISFQVGADGTDTIVAQVPEKAGVTSSFLGQITAKALDRNPVVTTNGLQFSFTPVIAPSIEYIEPVEVGPGAAVRLDGNNFVQGDVVHFVIPGVSDYASPTVFGGTRLTASVQQYVAKDLKIGSVYIARSTPSVSSQAAQMIYKPTLPLILSVPDSAVAASPIVIRGMSFGGSVGGSGSGGSGGGAGGGSGSGVDPNMSDADLMKMINAENQAMSAAAAGGTAQVAGAAGGTAQVAGAPQTAPTVTNPPPPGAEIHLIEQSGTDIKMQVDYWTDTRIVARVPGLAGFVNAQNCTVYVRTTAGRSDSKPLSVTPIIAIAPMFLQELYADQDLTFSDPSLGVDTWFLNPPNPGLWLHGYHAPSFFAGNWGEDTYFNNHKLRNGWVVAWVDFTGTNATLDEKRVGTDSPYLKISWCETIDVGLMALRMAGIPVTPWNTAQYQVSIWVKGPLGTMY